MKHCLCLIALLLVACGKEAPQPDQKAKAATAIPKPAPEIKLPPVPQGKLPQMDPEKAKFIAVPSTPKDPEVEKAADKPKVEVKKVEKPSTETKKAAAPAAVAKPADQPVHEVKKAAPAADKQ
jgi:PBP1b-binding outer membrane lipoprotein LpoB